MSAILISLAEVLATLVTMGLAWLVVTNGDRGKFFSRDYWMNLDFSLSLEESDDTISWGDIEEEFSSPKNTRKATKPAGIFPAINIPNVVVDVVSDSLRSSSPLKNFNNVVRNSIIDVGKIKENYKFSLISPSWETLKYWMKC